MDINKRQASPAQAGRALAEQQTTVTLLMRTVALLEQAMSQHIYDAASGEKPGPECAYAALLSDLKNFLKRPAVLPKDVLAEGLRLIASQSVGADYTHEEAFEFIRATAKAHLAVAGRMPPPKLVMVVSGGNLQSMHGTKPFPSMDIVLVDHDHLRAAGVEAPSREAMEATEIANCPLAVQWDTVGSDVESTVG